MRNSKMNWLKRNHSLTVVIESNLNVKKEGISIYMHENYEFMKIKKYLQKNLIKVLCAKLPKYFLLKVS